MILRVVSLGLFACLTLPACGGGGSTPANAAPTSAQTVTTSTVTGTPLSAQAGSISLTAELPQTSAATTVAYSFATNPPTDITVEPAIAYFCLTPTATVSFTALPTFTITAPNSVLPAGSVAYVELFNPATSAAGWISEQGPLAIQTASGLTFNASPPLGPAASATFEAGQTSCFAFSSLSQFGSTTVGI